MPHIIFLPAPNFVGRPGWETQKFTTKGKVKDKRWYIIEIAYTLYWDLRVCFWWCEAIPTFPSNFHVGFDQCDAPIPVYLSYQTKRQRCIRSRYCVKRHFKRLYCDVWQYQQEQECYGYSELLQISQLLHVKISFEGQLWKHKQKKIRIPQ